jgi:hypothetical protein
MSVTREELLAIKPQVITVKAPELGKGRTLKVKIPSALASEKLDVADWPVGPDGRSHLQREGRKARWFIACVVKDDGSALFSEADVEVVNGFPASLLTRVFNAVQEDPAEAIEDAVKNS